MTSKNLPKNKRDSKISYLAKAQLLLIHSLLIDETGGSHGVRDYHALFSLAHLPQQTFDGEELYPTLFLKAALYARNIIQNHPFLDGNKRTGMTAAIVFLNNNGFSFSARKGEILSFALKIVKEKLELVKIAAWLKQHCSGAAGRDRTTDT